MPLSARHSAATCETCQHRTLRLFCNLTPQALHAFSAIGASVDHVRGEILFHEGDPAESVYVVCSGQTKLSCNSTAGKSMILKIAGPGDVLGLSAVLSGQPHEVTAEALEPLQLRVIPRPVFLKFLAQYGEASLHAAQSIQTEYRSAFINARLLALSGSASGRLAHVLLNWAESAACGKPDLRFTMALTHEELGSMANISRETVTRLLSRFQKEKLLAVRGATMVILDAERMRELAA
jgi:CRP/FNR family transcriptional regulator, cyclic AMP receptor protein